MSTGDVLNNINILKSALRNIKYEGIEPDWEL